MELASGRTDGAYHPYKDSLQVPKEERGKQGYLQRAPPETFLADWKRIFGDRDRQEPENSRE